MKSNRQGKISTEFKEGPIHAELLGAVFDIYSHTKMYDFIITNIQWDDDKKKQLKYIYQIQLMENGNYLENIMYDTY